MREPARLLLFVAHPDDETFGCGSLLAHASDLGAECTVVCATRGEAGEPAAGSGVARSELAAVRADELHRAAASLGVARVVLLDWRDSGMEGDPADGSLVSVPLDEVAARFAAIIDDVRPSVVVTLDASDGHRDHAHVRDAAIRAADESTWDVPRVYLHCLPRELMRQWAEIVRDEVPESAYLAVRDLGTPADRVTTVIDTAYLLGRREAAIALHASQTSPFEVMPDDLRRAFLTEERLQRVRPRWDGGPSETELFTATAVLGDPTPG